MANTAPDIATYIDALTHRRKDDIDALRRIVHTSHPDLTESVKWNAPSYAIDDNHRITFRLQPGDRVDLVFHRGSKSRADAATFEFFDPTGMVTWSTPDRGVVDFVDASMIRDRAGDLGDLVRAWVEATT